MRKTWPEIQRDSFFNLCYCYTITGNAKRFKYKNYWATWEQDGWCYPLKVDERYLQNYSVSIM